MRYLKTYNLYEKSSLTSLGVPSEVMKNIQYNYEIQIDAEWDKIFYKKDIKLELKKDEISLFLEININFIKIIINLGNNIYIQQYFKYNSSGWGGYDIRNRENLSITQILLGINSKSNIYKLKGDFQYNTKAQRKIQKEMKNFDKITNDFKFYILHNFNRIIQRIYGARYEKVMSTIASNIKNINPNATKDEILDFLKNNKKMVEKAKELENAKNIEDFLRITELEKKYNSLPILDEYLIKFEDGYSDKYNIRLSIQDLIKDFGRMKIETAFIFYLFTNKLKSLNVQKNK
jgi:hypothetical protein